MRVVALVSFAGSGVTVARGAVIEMPEGADWLRAGLVAPVEEPIESATADGPAPHMVGVEHAIDPAPAKAEKRKRKSITGE